MLTGDAVRRAPLRDWLHVADAIAVEDDYDAEFRYDRQAVGALQGLEPERVVYCGSASKTLAPSLRMGWLVVPPRLHAAVAEEKFLADQGTARIEQRAMAAFISRGELDRHPRRMRLHYRARRDALMTALADAVPGASVHGIAAGLHLTVRLPERHDEQRLRDAAADRRLELSTLSDYRAGAFDDDPVLLLGYSQLNEASIPRAVEELALVLNSSA
jgi:GntR family transcriptional regulator / MocR family aminotransferase